jgi:hypothetical protein
MFEPPPLPDIPTRLMRVHGCCMSRKQEPGITFKAILYDTDQAVYGCATLDNRPENFAEGRLKLAMMQDYPAIIGKHYPWDHDFPKPIPAVLDDMDQLLRSRRLDDYLYALYRKLGWPQHMMFAPSGAGHEAIQP